MIDFNKYLTPEQQTALAQQRLQQLAAEAWGHDQNRQLAIASGDTEAANQAAEAIEIIARAIEITENGL